jgi:catechol 2,3-dioxygenase-like lactoylglutathione lyase family enzyme
VTPLEPALREAGGAKRGPGAATFPPPSGGGAGAPAALQVLGLRHVNLFAAEYERIRDFHARVFGAATRREWKDLAGGGMNALWSLGGTDVELFSPLTPDRAIGHWVARHGSGWHSVNWVVPSLADALRGMASRGIRVVEHVEGAYAFLHPRDCRGLTVSLNEPTSSGDPTSSGEPIAADDGEEPLWPGSSDPLGLLSGPMISVASRAPDEAAAWLADLVGVAGPVTTDARGDVGTHSAAVSLGDHVVEFVSPLPGAAADQLATFLAQEGERFYSLSLRVADLEVARSALRARRVTFEQSRRGSLVLGSTEAGAPVELRADP